MLEDAVVAAIEGPPDAEEGGIADVDRSQRRRWCGRRYTRRPAPLPPPRDATNVVGEGEASGVEASVIFRLQQAQAAHDAVDHVQHAARVGDRHVAAQQRRGSDLRGKGRGGVGAPKQCQRLFA